MTTHQPQHTPGVRAKAHFDPLVQQGLTNAPLATFNPSRTQLPMKDLAAVDSELDLIATLDVDDAHPAKKEAFSTMPGTAAAPLKGSEFDLRKVLARGGMGEVWVARQSALKREVAVKTLLLQSLAGTPEEVEALRQSFHEEALITANLTHPNILPIHDLGVSPTGNLLLAMKRVRGRTWEEILKADFNGMNEAAYVRKHLLILQDVCKALQYAHSRGVMHRDLKPQQVMVGEFGEVQLMDWGLAVVFNPVLAQEQMPALFEPEPELATEHRGNAPKPQPKPIGSMEHCSNPAGTPAYMAPEQCEYDSKRLGPWTDIFLVGALLYRILTGSPPYKGSDSLECLMLASVAHRPTMAERAPGRWIPWELEQLTTWCMQQEPANRPRTIVEVQRALSDYLAYAERRWDSMDITTHVASSIGAEHVTAAYLAGLASQLDQAYALWKENPSIEPLRQKVAATFAHFVATKDPEVARALMLAEGLQDRPLRDYLIAYLERAYGTATRKKWLLLDIVVFFTTLIFLLLVLVLFVELVT